MTKTPDQLIPPHGGIPVNLLARTERAAQLGEQSCKWRSWTLSQRQLCDLELLLIGGFSPRDGFMGRRDYEHVVVCMRLTDGTFWLIPIVLDVTETFARKLKPGQPVTLRTAEGALLALFHTEEVWEPDRIAEAQAIYGMARMEDPVWSICSAKLIPSMPAAGLNPHFRFKVQLQTLRVPPTSIFMRVSGQ